MSYHKIVTLRCDCSGCDGCGQSDTETGCLEWFEYDRSSATEAREVAREREGWSYSSGEDYCGDCSGRQ